LQSARNVRVNPHQVRDRTGSLTWSFLPSCFWPSPLPGSDGHFVPSPPAHVALQEGTFLENRLPEAPDC